MKLWSSMGVLVLLIGSVSIASAQEKSWEVDIYGDEAEVTYIPDGRDDIHVYDHNNHYNDRSYIEVDRPRYGYRDDFDHGYSTRHYGYHRQNRHHAHYGGYRGHGRYYDRPVRYRVEYHNRYRHW